MKQAEVGARVNRFLESEEWNEAWDTYRDTLLAAMLNPKFSMEDVQHQRMLLWAATQAKQNLEAMVTDGKVAAATINLEHEKESAIRRVMRRFAA